MNSDRTTSDRDACVRSRSALGEYVVGLVVLLLCGWLYCGAARPARGEWFSREPSGYYGLLTAGFRSGHLYAAINPHPGLLALTDPYDPVANAPYRVHDMSLWRGHYYLYYGVTPVLIFFWPIVATTGWYPTEALAVALFSWSSVAAAVVLLIAMRRRYYPSAPTSVLAMAVLCLAFANPVATLDEGLQFYQVPIACAAALHMMMFGAVYLALRGEQSAGAWLAAASALGGLAVGARPNYVLSAVVLLMPLVVLVWRERKGRWFRAIVRFGVMAGGPLLVCGLGLMLYNWLRFDSPTEFGMRFSLGGEKVLDTHLIALANVGAHLGDYLFTPGIWSRYFPFFAPPAGAPHGALRYAPWLLLAAFAWFFRARRDPIGGYWALVTAMTFAVLANLGLLAFFFGLTDRYPPDFVPVWLLLAGIGALAISAWLAEHAPRWERTGKSVLAIGALVTLFFGLTVFVSRLSEPRRILSLARVLNWPACLWERAHGVQFGPARLELDVPQHRGGHSEPLIESGVARDRRDWLQLAYLSDDRARVGFFHAGLGLLLSRVFAVPPDHRLTVEAQFGALLPPYAHPVFHGWSWGDYVARRRDVWVQVNGQEVLRAVLESYASPPQLVTIGATRWIGSGIDQKFSGRVRAMDRLPFDQVRPPRAAWQGSVPMELHLLWPADRKSGREPLIVTGRGKQSDLLYCIYEGAGRARLGVDHYGNGGPVGEAFSIDPLQPHILTVWMGSLADATVPAVGVLELPWNRRLTVLLDGQPVLNTEQVFYRSRPENVVFARNIFGSTVSESGFSGRITAVQSGRFDDIPPMKLTGDYGAVALKVVFPRYVLGTAEPLVVTGLTGAGDIVYVRYVDAQHVSFGFDHWGIGGLVGEPVPVDPNIVHRVEVTIGSLYPAPAPARWSTRVRVRLDGHTVLDGESPCYPASRTEIRLMENPIGGSTCGPRFTGEVRAVERSALPKD